jgi:hypothetical protein
MEVKNMKALFYASFLGMLVFTGMTATAQQFRVSYPASAYPALRLSR